MAERRDTSTPVPSRSEYNSMQMKVDRRMRNGLSLTNSYTLGRAYSFANGDGRRDDLHSGGLGAWLPADHV